MSEDIAAEVIRIVAEQLELDPAKVKPEHAFVDDLKADSLAVAEALLQIEERFNIEIPDEEMDSIRTVKQAIDYIQDKVG